MSIEDAYIELLKINKLQQEAITKLNKEKAKLKEKLEKIKKAIRTCKHISCANCAFYKLNCLVADLIEGAEDENS